MACEGKSLTARDLAEIMAKTHHPEGQDAREVPVERESEGDGDSLGQSSERQQWLEVLCPVPLIRAVSPFRSSFVKTVIKVSVNSCLTVSLKGEKWIGKKCVLK